MPPDRSGTLTINFSPSLKLPLSCTRWSSDNEGLDRLSIEYKPSDETQTLIYDQDLIIGLDWQVEDANITNVVWLNESNNTGILQDLSFANAT